MAICMRCESPGTVRWMSGWSMGGIALTFFGIAWAIDAFLSTSALVAFTVAMLIGPPLVLEVFGQARRRLSSAHR